MIKTILWSILSLFIGIIVLGFVGWLGYFLFTSMIALLIILGIIGLFLAYFIGQLILEGIRGNL